jgi:lipopolysaccharide transport system permease protein
MLGFDKNDLSTISNFLRATVRDKYLGTSLGSIWGIAQPLLMFVTFTFVFGFVFKARLPGAETTLSYAIWLICGYGPWLSISESTMAAANSVVSSAGIVKNLAIKTEVLPVVGVLSGMLPLLVSLLFVMPLLVFDGNGLTWHAALVIPIALLQIFFLVGIGFLLAAVTVFLRDFAFALPNLLMVVLFASPIFYPIESMPRIAQWLSQFNPFFVICDSYRDVLVYHRVPNLLGLAFVIVVSIVMTTATLTIFRRIKGYFEAAL